MFFSFSPTEILYISSRVLLYVFRFSFCFCVNNGLEKKNAYENRNMIHPLPWYERFTTVMVLF